MKINHWLLLWFFRSFGYFFIKPRLVEEYSFDPMMIAEYYKDQINREPNFTINMTSRTLSAEKDGECWKVNITDRLHATGSWIKASRVINATYSGTNTINELFDVNKFDLMHEITEIACISSPLLPNVRFSIMAIYTSFVRINITF